MESIEPNPTALVVFSIAWTLGCIGALYVAGFLPLAAAPVAAQQGIGFWLVLLNVAIAVILIAVTLLYGINELRWTSLVIAGGLIFLFAPPAATELPKALQDTRVGLAIAAILMTAGLVILASAGAFEMSPSV